MFLVACSSNNVNNTDNSDMAVPGGDLSTTPDQGAMACDVIKQDCPTGQKCALTGGGGMAPTPTCVMAGTVTDGQPCMRGMMGAPDNCAAGLVCSRSGACRKYCAADTDCDSGQKCAAGRVSTTIGTCSPACTPFGTDCGTQNCSGVSTSLSGSTFFTCRTPGTTPNFGDCGAGAGGASCGANAVCDPNAGWCAPICDSTHTCPANPADGGGALSCMSLMTSISGDPGICAQ
jgi:hypothetical protein